MPYLAALTSLRFFAAAAIVIHHLVDRIWIQHEWVAGWSLAHGVSVFFVLSGFILARQYPVVAGSGGWGRFLWNRAARIYPSHLAILMLTLYLYGYGGDAARIVANALLLHSWVPDGTFFFSYNNVSWSLSTEMAFYTLFPLLVFRPGLWKVFLPATFMASLGTVWLSYQLQLPAYDPMSTAWTNIGLTMVNPLARIFEFSVGVAAAAAFRAMPASLKLGVTAATAVELTAVAALVWNISLKAATYGPWLPDFGDAGGFWFNNCLAPAVPAAFLILALARGEGLISHILTWPPLQYLGAISFATYLVHPIVIREIEHRLEGPVALAVFIPAVLLASIILHEVVERPAQKFLRRLTPRAAGDGSRLPHRVQASEGGS